MTENNSQKINYAELTGLGVLLFGFFLASLYNYLFFHTLAELFSIIIAFGIFIVAWNSRRFMDTGYPLFLGIGFLFIGSIDLLHTMAYKGMGIFPGFDADLPTQLWISARYIESLTLLAAPLFISRTLNHKYAFGIYSAVILVLFMSIFGWRNFPECFIEGHGLTSFKVISEYIISLILLGALALWLFPKEEFPTLTNYICHYLWFFS